MTADAVEGVITIVDPADPRVDDYRGLNDIAARAEMERDEYFLGEGYVPIDRMLDSGHRMRSVLLHPKRLKRFIPTMSRPEMAGVPVYVAEQAVIAEVVGFDMYRCCLASAFRAPMPTVAELAARAGDWSCSKGSTTIRTWAPLPGHPGRSASTAWSSAPPATTRTNAARSGSAWVRSSTSRWLGPEPTTGLPPWHTLHDAGFATWALTPGRGAQSTSGISRFPTGSPPCSAPKAMGSSRRRWTQRHIGFGSRSHPMSTRSTSATPQPSPSP